METETQLKCYYCPKLFDRSVMQSLNSNHWACNLCYESNLTSCASCSERFILDFSEYTVCSDCEDIYCGNCSLDSCSQCDNYYCSDCLSENHDHSSANRQPDNRSTLFQSRNHGEIIKSSRKFGVELEVIGDNSDALNLPDACGITGDASLSDKGVEIITPVISGKKGEDLIKTICVELEKNSFFVDRSCGFHVHIDATRMLGNADKIKTLWLFYLIYEDIFLAMLPKSRRINNYCRTMRNIYGIPEILRLKNTDDIEALWYKVREMPLTDIKHKIAEYKRDHYNQTRYTGINLHSLLVNGHYEIRYHGGTIQPEKILFWTNLHLKIADMIASEKIMPDNVIYQSNQSLTLTDKLETFFNLIKIKKDSPIHVYFVNRIKRFTPNLEREEEILKTCAV